MSALDKKEHLQLIENQRLFLLILGDCAELMAWAAERGHPTADQLLVKTDNLITGIEQWLKAYENS